MPASFPMRLAAIAIRLTMKNVFTEENYRAWQAEVEGRDYPPHAPLPARLRKKFNVEETALDGFPIITVSPKQDARPLHLLYLHGGVYVLPLISQHWMIIEALVSTLNATVSVATYPLAPEHTYEATLSHLETVYQHILAESADSRIVVAGDSAGGGLALSLSMIFRDNGTRLPDRLILLSPWVDVTLSDPAVEAVARDDFMLGIPGFRLAGQWWAGDADPKTPLISPLYGDLSGLPPMDLFIGTRDMLVVDARTLRDRVTAAGGTIHYYEYDGAMHVFVAASFAPESRHAYQMMADGLGIA